MSATSAPAGACSLSRRGDKSGRHSFAPENVAAGQVVAAYESLALYLDCSDLHEPEQCAKGRGSAWGC